MSTSLNTVGEIKAELIVRGQTSTTSAFLNDTILNDWIDQAYKRAVAFKKWPFTEGRVSTTFVSTTDEDGVIVSEYPEGWRSDSIRLLQIGGKTFQKKNFYQFKKYIEETPSVVDRIYSDFNRRIYINPNASAGGTTVAYGQYTPVLDITDEDATTVFSQGEVEGNEAIVEFMLSYLENRRQNTQKAEGHLAKAKEILDGIWERVGAEQFEYQTLPGDGMFKRIDVVRGDYRSDLFKRDQFS